MAIKRSAEIAALLRQFQELTASSPDSWGGVDLTITQLRALFVLARRQPLRVSDLAGALGLSLASGSALRRRLARLGYITRQHGTDDQRTVLLALSAKANRLLFSLQRRSTERLSSKIRLMTDAERAALALTLRAFVRLADKPTQAPHRRASRVT